MGRILRVSAVILSFLVTPAWAQDASHGTEGHAAPPQSPGSPSLPRQDAFGAAQEIVQVLESDPSTDWLKVNMDRLRERLIDMNELALRAKAVVAEMPDGISIHISGQVRTLEAIRRLIPAQANELGRSGVWDVAVAHVADGEKLTIQAEDAKEVAKIKGLGYFGLITSGSHHQRHHFMIASGQHF